MLNAAPLLTFPTKAVVLDIHASSLGLLKVFTNNISELGLVATTNESAREEKDDSEGDGEMTIKAEDGNTVARKETDTITADYENVLAFL